MNKKIAVKRIIGEKDLQEMQTTFDSTHVVQMDMRGHTGGVSTFFIGFLMANLSKKMMNLISSNESEVIGNSI